MNFSKVIAALVWVLALDSCVPALAILLSPSLRNQASAAELSAAMALFPLVLMAASVLWVRRDPFDVVRLRLWIDNKLGDGVYAAFIRNLRPFQLVGISGIAAGLLGVILAFRANDAFN